MTSGVRIFVFNASWCLHSVMDSSSIIEVIRRRNRAHVSVENGLCDVGLSASFLPLGAAT